MLKASPNMCDLSDEDGAVVGQGSVPYTVTDSLFSGIGQQQCKAKSRVSNHLARSVCLPFSATNNDVINGLDV